MFLFNTTFLINERQQGWWQVWIDQTYIPQMTAAAPDATHELYVIDGVQQGGGRSFASQWRTESISSLGKLREVATKLCHAMTDEKGEDCLAFSTLMKTFVP